MYYCIDKSFLKPCDYVQKSLPIEEIFNNHTKYYEDVSEALEDNFVPLYVCTSIRTLFTNLVVEDSVGEYYVFNSPVAELVHKGYDLIMYLTSLNAFNFLSYEDGFDELMVKKTMFQPIGIYYNSDNYALFCTHILVADESALEFAKFFKKGAKFTPIIHMNYKNKIKAVLNELVVVDKEESNECHNS